jgi:hypothetical protein
VVYQGLQIGQNQFGIRTNSELFAVWVEEFLGEYLIEDDDLDPVYSVWIAEPRKVGTGFHTLYKESEAVTRSFDLSAVVRTLLFELESMLFSERDDALYVNEALVVFDGVTALVPAITVPYLGNLGRSLERSGLQLPVAQWIAIDIDSGNLVPIIPRLSVEEDALEYLGFGGDGKRRSAGFVVESPLKVDVVCSAGTEDEQVRPASRAETVYTLAHRAQNLDLLGTPALETLDRLAAGARCCEIRAVKPAQTLEALTEAMRALESAPAIG